MRYWLLVSLVTLLGCCMISANAYRLAFKDTVGATYTFKSDFKITGQMVGGSLNAPIDSTVNMTSQEKVNSINNGIASITYSVKDGKMVATLSGLPGDQSSQTIEQDIPAFTMTFNRSPQGKVSNLKFSGDAANIFGGPFDAVTNQMQDPGQGLLFPDRELSIGDSWNAKQTMQVGQGSPFTITAKYTLLGTEVVNGKTYLKIQCDITASTPGIAMHAGQQTQGLNMSMSMSLTGTAVTLFDGQAGQIFRETMKMHAVLHMKMGSDNEDTKATIDLNGTMNQGT